MTDTELARRMAICEAAGVGDIGEISDGFHTFNSLYEQRMIMFAALVKAYKDKSWKSYRHEDGEYCFGGGWFIVGIDTPEGSYTYHYENKYWDMFDCTDLPRAKHWDGHTEADVETRLMSLQPEHKTGRLIDADVLKQHIDKLPALPDGNFAGNHSALKALINMQPTIEPSTNCSEIPNNWIPCSERLPEDPRQVLVYARSVHYALAKYDEMREADGTYKKQWVTFDAWKPFYTIKDVIKWMPLP